METELRQLALADATELGRAGAQLSPGWWRQLGEEQHVLVAEAHLANLEAMHAEAAAAGPDAPKKRILSRDSYNVEAVLGLKRRGWLRVAWEGYHPSWETWRKEGEVGVAPVITWERRKSLLKTEAYARRGWRRRSRRGRRSCRCSSARDAGGQRPRQAEDALPEEGVRAGSCCT